MPGIPYVIKNTKNGQQGMDIFSRLLDAKIITIFSEINTQLAEIVTAELLYLDSLDTDYSEKNPIKIYIDSPGGSVVDGLAIHDVMMTCKHHIEVLCIGMAASMAAVILSAGDRRLCTPQSEIMIHQPLGGAKGQATEILIAAEHIKATKLRLNTILSENTGKSLDTIAADTDRDNYMTAEEALEYGLIDEIIQYTAEGSELKPSLARRRANAEKLAGVMAGSDSDSEKETE